MKLALIRHAEAVVLGDAGTKTDFDRMLTPHGEQQSRALASTLSRLGITPGLILSSPLIRAWQTAEHLAVTLTPGTEPTQCDGLASGVCQFKKLTQEVAECDQSMTFLVGHMPDLSEYASWLLGAEAGAIDFKKAAIAMFRFNGSPSRGSGVLKWLVTPDWFMTS